MTDPRHDGAAVGGSVYPARLWAGGGAVALVAALIAAVGLLLCRGVLDIPVLAPEGEGAWGDADTASYALVAALVALAATGLMHLLLLFTPRPHSFFGWVMSLTTLARGARTFHRDGGPGRPGRHRGHQSPSGDRHRDAGQRVGSQRLPTVPAVRSGPSRSAASSSATVTVRCPAPAAHHGLTGRADGDDESPDRT